MGNMYVDGVLQTTRAGCDTTGVNAVSDKSTFCVGKSYSSEYMTGQIRNVQIFNVEVPADFDFAVSDPICPSPFVSAFHDMSGDGKVWEQPHPDPSRTIEDCGAVCEARDGCTGFEFAEGPSETGACGTYTAGSANHGG